LIYTVESKEKMNQSMTQVSPRHIKIKGDLKSDDFEKKKEKIDSEKFLRENKNILKELEKKSPKAKPYTREPWMMRFNPTEDKYEEFLRKEVESF